MTVFLGRTEAQDSSLRFRRFRNQRLSSSTSIHRVTRFFLLLTVLCILVIDSSLAQTKPQSAASLIYERCHSSVVVVVPMDKDDKPLGQGSGFIIAANSVVTNHHVLADATSAVVIFADGGTEVAEGFLADNPTRDITIVSVKTGTRTHLKLGDELSLKQGDEVYAIGAPRGLDLSITNGIVSGFRSIEDQFLLQTTAAIAPGSSGGPLFDRDGSVIGVTTSLLTESPGIYFSVGIGDVARILRSASTIVLPISSLSGSAKVDSLAKVSPEIQTISKMIDEKDYAAARDQLKPLIEKSPQDPTLNRMLGEVDLFEGHVQPAIAHLKVAVEANPSDTDSNFFYAIGLFLAGQYDDSGHYQELVVQANPSAPNIGVLAEIYYAQQNYSKAETQALKALGKDPSEDTALEVIAGNLYWGRSQSGYSWQDVQERLAKAKSDSYWVKVGSALGLMQQKKYDDAISILMKAKQDSFPDPAADFLLSSLYVQQGQVGLARSETEGALAIYPYNKRLLNQGMFLALIGHDETAAGRYYSRLSEVSNGGGEQLSAACLYYYGIGKSAEAVDSCSKGVTANPSDHTAHSNLGWAALDADQFTLALREFSSAYNLVKDTWKDLTVTQAIDLIWGFAIASYSTGDKKTCKKLLQDIKASNPSMLTLTGLEQLPLVWSRKTTSRIEQILRDIRP
jgi:S1-C subfamily serine protease/tetratricopeptide (TPR) repeat protein